MTSNSKVCPLCAEAIPAAAKVCPRCRQWLTLRSFRHPFTWALVVGIPTAVVPALFFFLMISRVEGIFNPRPLYAEMPDSLSVAESRMLWVETTNGPRIYVIGMLTNQSMAAWKDVELQCRFYGTNGTLIDAAYPLARLTILPSSDAAFRGTIAPGRPRQDYHTLSVTVSSARNARAAFL